MQVEYIDLDFDEIFSYANDEFNNDFIVSLQNYDNNANKAMIRFEESEVMENNNNLNIEQEIRVRQVLHTIANNNKFSISIDFFDINIPNHLLTEWIQINKYITTVCLNFYRNENIHDLAYAIHNDTIITNLDINIMHLSNRSIDVLSEAFHHNKSIQSLTIGGTFGIEHNVFFERGIGFNKHIQHLEFFCPKVGPVPVIGNAFLTNNSLTSLHCRLDGFEQTDSIISGIVVSEKIKKVKFTFSQSYFKDKNDQMKADFMLTQTITNMQHIKNLEILFDDVKYISTNLMKALRESNAYIHLSLSHADKETMQKLFNEVSSWKRQPEIEIIYLDPSDDSDFSWNVLKEIRLTKLYLHIKAVSVFSDIVDVLPQLKQLEMVHLVFLDETLARQVVRSQHGKLAAAVSDNYSVKTVETIWDYDDDVTGDTQAEKWINQSLQRNKFLSECQATSGKIPTELLPVFIEFAGNSLDLSFDLFKSNAGQLFQGTIHQPKNN